MKYCKLCLATDLRPNAKFYGGICIACAHSATDRVNTAQIKLLKLKRYIKERRKAKRNPMNHDCIVGVSGGKDSTRQAHWVRDKLGLNPLLVCAAYPPLQMSDVGAHNLGNLISMGFDIVVSTPSPKSAARLSLESFKRFGNVCTSTELSLFSTVPRVAIETGINFIFWGENPALQVGDSAVLGENEFDGNNLRNLNTLSSSPIDWIEACVSEPYKQEHYTYPSQDEFLKKNISIMYLGPAWEDWSVEQNATYAALNGLNLRPNEENLTGDISNASMLDEEFTNINMMIKYYKFGFGRATDQVNEAIRLGKISREEAIEIVEKYDGVCSKSIIEKYCAYVGISTREFWEITNSFVNNDIFQVRKNLPPIKMFRVGTDYAN